MQKLVVTLPKKMPLAMRISKASSQIREWLQIVDVAFNDERDKLQLTKWELKNREYRYHYSIIKEKASSASQVSSRRKGHTLDTSETPDSHCEIEDQITDVHLGPDPFL
ncbi:MAG: hypothetical protein MUO68_08590 [Desulfobacteraceae bacterium]|nr:hypothetical protein [Desulfobacteraceae bacterium]